MCHFVHKLDPSETNAIHAHAKNLIVNELVCSGNTCLVCRAAIEHIADDLITAAEQALDRDADGLNPESISFKISWKQATRD